MSTEWQKGKRIINVSNRLPVKLTLTDNKLAFQPSEGGLATGLSSVFNTCKNVWIGWPGAVVNEAEQAAITADLIPQCLHPIYLSQEEINNYYEGFSNETLWPLFHYFPTYSKYSRQHWDSYMAVNRKFADAVIALATADDIVWIQDYQLMLVPAMVREALPGITIGYFQHIPFPDYEIFRALPWKEQILNGLLGADTIGFQTEDDERHFISTVARVLGMQADGGEFIINNRGVNVQAFPISIDFKKFSELAVAEATDVHAHKIKQLIDTRIAISIDRLDYSKGILQRLQAYDLFLEKYPEWQQQITLVHLVVPSRDTVGNYKELKEEMNKLVSNINGKYATLGWQPIHHFYRSFPPHMLSALYKTADLALVTPLRDGMNLVSKEYVAGNISMNGMLILSEAAGAAKELTDALIINPNDVNAFADKIHEGLNMSAEEKKRRMGNMRNIIEQSDIFLWAGNFMSKLMNTDNKKTLNVCTPIEAEIKEKIELAYSVAHKRLLLLDYDGTLVPFYNKPEDAYPDSELLSMLRTLAADKRNSVVVISGRDRVTLDSWLGHLPIDIVGEHGAWFKEPGKKWYSVPGLHSGWKNEISKTLDLYTFDVPGSFIEEKAYSLAWHYRAAEDALGAHAASDIVNLLKNKLAGKDLELIQGNKVIEIKSSLVNKGKAALSLVAKNDYDLIIAIGDDRTDEDMFNVLPGNSISVKVGSNISAATYCHKSYLDVRTMLDHFAGAGAKHISASNLVLVVQ